MAVFSGNPADRRMGAAPGSVAEASRAGTSSISNGTTRNNSFSGTLGRDLGDRGFRSDAGGIRVGSMKDQSRFQQPNSSIKGNYMGTKTDRVSSMQSVSSTGPVSRNISRTPTATMSAPPARMSGIQDYKSIVPGRVTMTAEKVPFAQKNPSLAKYMGGTPAKPVNVSVDEAQKMAATVPKVGAYVSGASTLAKKALGPEALKQLGTVKKGYGTTTLQAGKGILSGTIDVSYPKSVATGKSFGTYKAGPLSSTGPVSRGVQPKASTGPVSRGVQPKASTGPVSRGVPNTPKGPTYYDVNYRRDVAEAFRKPSTVAEVRVQSKQKKASTVASRVTKDGYVYTRVGNRLQNFGAETSSNNRNRNRMRRNEK